MVTSLAQTQINNSVPFQTDPSKDYSLVIPTSYVEGETTAAFLALHPWNTSKWNGETWCEELADFAEENKCTHCVGEKCFVKCINKNQCVARSLAIRKNSVKKSDKYWLLAHLFSLENKNERKTKSTTKRAT